MMKLSIEADEPDVEKVFAALAEAFPGMTADDRVDLLDKALAWARMASAYQGYPAGVMRAELRVEDTRAPT